MVDRVQFGPLRGVNPQVLFAQRESRLDLAASVSGPGAAGNVPEAPDLVEAAREASAAERREQAQAQRQTQAPALGGDQGPEIDTQGQIRQLVGDFIESSAEGRSGGQAADLPALSSGTQQGIAFGAGAPGVPGIERTNPAPLGSAPGGLRPPGLQGGRETRFGGFEAQAVEPLGDGGDVERPQAPEEAPAPLGGGTASSAAPEPAPPAPAQEEASRGPRGAIVDTVA